MVSLLLSDAQLNQHILCLAHRFLILQGTPGKNWQCSSCRQGSDCGCSWCMEHKPQQPGSINMEKEFKYFKVGALQTIRTPPPRRSSAPTSNMHPSSAPQLPSAHVSGTSSQRPAGRPGHTVLTTLPAAATLVDAIPVVPLPAHVCLAPAQQGTPQTRNSGPPRLAGPPCVRLASCTPWSYQSFLA